MTACFADTYYFLALLNPRDAGHEAVRKVAQNFRRPIVTTSWVVTEIADGMALPPARNVFVRFYALLCEQPGNLIVEPSPQLFDEGMKIYERHRDKEWSLTDCISFVVMRQMKLTDALTADHHFAQAGFKVLLK